MELKYTGGVTYCDINAIGLAGVRHWLSQNGSKDPVLLHFGCDTGRVNKNALLKAVSAILNDPMCLAYGRGCQFNPFNILNNMCKPVAMMVNKEYLLANWWRIDSSEKYAFLLSLAYMYDKTVMVDEDIVTEIDTEYCDIPYGVSDEYLVECSVVIVPTKNRCNLATAYTLVKRQHPDLAFIALLNTKDKSFEAIKKYCDIEHIQYMTYDYNFNYSKIHNDVMLRTWCGMPRKYAILLNDDIVLSTDILELVKPFTIDERVGVVGSKLYFPDMTIQHAGVEISKGVIRHIGRCKPDSLAYDQFQFMDAVTFAYVAVKADAFMKIGGFDQNLPYDLNDIDFCVRCRQAGMKILYNPDSRAIHFESMTRKADSRVGVLEDYTYFKEKHKGVLK